LMQYQYCQTNPLFQKLVRYSGKSRERENIRIKIGEDWIKESNKVFQANIKNT
jgi:hypothetical protein